MPERSVPDQITYRYRKNDSVAGITGATAKRFAGLPGVTKTQLAHQALSEQDSKLQSPYEADDGPLTTAQMREIENAVPQGIKRPIRSSLFELDIT